MLKINADPKEIEFYSKVAKVFAEKDQFPCHGTVLIDWHWQLEGIEFTPEGARFMTILNAPDIIGTRRLTPPLKWSSKTTQAQVRAFMANFAQREHTYFRQLAQMWVVSGSAFAEGFASA